MIIIMISRNSNYLFFLVSNDVAVAEFTLVSDFLKTPNYGVSISKKILRKV